MQKPVRIILLPWTRFVHREDGPPGIAIFGDQDFQRQWTVDEIAGEYSTRVAWPRRLSGRLRIARSDTAAEGVTSIYGLQKVI